MSIHLNINSKCQPKDLLLPLNKGQYSISLTQIQNILFIPGNTSEGIIVGYWGNLCYNVFKF